MRKVPVVDQTNRPVECLNRTESISCKLIRSLVWFRDTTHILNLCIFLYLIISHTSIMLRLLLILVVFLVKINMLETSKLLSSMTSTLSLCTNQTNAFSNRNTDTTFECTQQHYQVDYQNVRA